MKYTNLINLKNFLNITDNSCDTDLEKSIKIATKIFDKYLGFNLENKVYREYFRDFNSDKIYINFGYKLNKVNKITLYNEEIKNYKIEDNVVYLDWIYDWELFIEYEAWYSNLEDIPDVEYSALKLCKKIFENTDNNIRSQSIDDINISYYSEKDSKDIFNYKVVLDEYKNMKINKI